MSLSSQLIVNGVGVCAALCSMTSFVPQAVKIIRERDARSVSRGMYVVTVMGFAFWTVYGALLHSWPLIVSNAISFSLSALILGLKIVLAKPEDDPRDPP